MEKAAPSAADVVAVAVAVASAVIGESDHVAASLRHSSVDAGCNRHRPNDNASADAGLQTEKKVPDELHQKILARRRWIDGHRICIDRLFYFDQHRRCGDDGRYRIESHI